MKSKNYLIKKYSYYNGNSNYGEEFFPFNEYMPPGVVLDKEDYADSFEDRGRDGQEFKEFEEFRRDRAKKIKKLKLLRKLKNKKKDVFQPHPFYSSMYGYTGFEGAYTSPLEYYSGSVADGPEAQNVNPYNNTWQLASDNSVKIIIRSMILKDFYKISTKNQANKPK